MNVFVRLVEGAPFSYAVVLMALLAIGAAVAQLVKRDRDLSGLVFGALATLGLLTLAAMAHGLSILAEAGFADPATKVVLIARGCSSGLAVVYFAGPLGALAALAATIACTVAPHRRAESALRGLAFVVAFASSFVAAMHGEGRLDQIAMADESAKGVMFMIAIGETTKLLAMGLFVAMALAAASAIVSVRGARAAV